MRRQVYCEIISQLLTTVTLNKAEKEKRGQKILSILLPFSTTLLCEKAFPRFEVVEMSTANIVCH
jgi:hypothetical protein